MFGVYQKLKMNFPRTICVFQSRRAILLAIFTILITSSFAFSQDDEAIKFFNQGQDAHEKGDLLAAVRSYEEALKIIPEFPEAEYQKGNALLALNKTDDAEKAFRRAIELREDWSLPLTALGALLVEKNEFTEAEKLLLKAMELDESNFLAFSALIDLRLKTKANAENLKSLLEQAKILTSKAKPTATIWASRGALENALGDKPAAKISLSRALAIDPNNKNALMTRAEISLAEGDNAAAFQTAQNLSKLYPASVPVKFLQARTFAVSGKTTEALTILDSIPNPSSEIVSFKNRVIASNTENVADLEKQLEGDQKNAAILGRLCALERVANPAKALDYCRRAFEAEPKNLSHAVGFSAALVQAKQYEPAVLNLRKILEIAPDNSVARANLATALFQLKRYDEAIKEYLWLTEKQPDLAIAYYFLAISYDSLGKYLDAMANYQQFLALADKTQNKLEIEKVELRLPALQKLIKKK